MAFCRVSLGFIGGDWGSASSEPATDDLSGEGHKKGDDLRERASLTSGQR